MPSVQELIDTLNHEFPQCSWHYAVGQVTNDPAIECLKHERFMSKKFFRTALDLNSAIRNEIKTHHPEDKFQIVIP